MELPEQRRFPVNVVNMIPADVPGRYWQKSRRTKIAGVGNEREPENGLVELDRGLYRFRPHFCPVDFGGEGGLQVDAEGFVDPKRLNHFRHICSRDFFLISVGRGKVLQPMNLAEAEELMDWVYRISKNAPSIVATTEAPSCRGIALEKCGRKV